MYEKIDNKKNILYCLKFEIRETVGWIASCFYTYTLRSIKSFNALRNNGHTYIQVKYDFLKKGILTTNSIWIFPPLSAQPIDSFVLMLQAIWLA